MTQTKLLDIDAHALAEGIVLSARQRAWSLLEELFPQDTSFRANPIGDLDSHKRSAAYIDIVALVRFAQDGTAMDRDSVNVVQAIERISGEPVTKNERASIVALAARARELLIHERPVSVAQLAAISGGAVPPSAISSDGTVSADSAKALLRSRMIKGF